MPSRHIVRTFAPESYYHVYNRGVNKQNIFNDSEDYTVFLSLFKRHLSSKPTHDSSGRQFADLRKSVSFLAFCLMPNHFHLLIYNIEERGIADLMQRTMTAYSMYFNKRHNRVGALFQNTYKASLIKDDAYLWHISRYIHLNPQDINLDYVKYPYSSYAYYMQEKTADWLDTQRILDLHDGDKSAYAVFVEDYEAMRKMYQVIKHQLADR